MTINWEKKINKYKGLWVALTEDQQTVVGSGKTLVGAMTEAKKKGVDKPIVIRLPLNISPYVG